MVWTLDIRILGKFCPFAKNIYSDRIEWWWEYTMKKSIVIGSIVALMLLSTAISAKAFIPGPGTQVAIVPGPTSDNGGTLPSSDAAFTNFTFTNLPWANLTAGNLTSYQIVVLVFGYGDVISVQQATDLNTWVNNGGKLIIYDSEMTAQDYSWLPYPFTTNNAGAGGAYGTPITYNEANSLGDNTPASWYYINITQSDSNVWEDAVGDSNVIITQDINWCGDLEATNLNQVTGWVHAYAEYGNGTIIYNGFDIDYLGAGTVPGTVGIANLAKVWLLELAQPWGTDYNLPCSEKVAGPVGGEIIESPVLPNLIIAAAAITVLSAAFVLLSRKSLRTRFPRLLK
jgi:hypothetical protein